MSFCSVLVGDKMVVNLSRFLLLQEAEEGTALGTSSKSLQGALGGDVAGAMTRSLLQALRSGGSAGQHNTAPFLCLSILPVMCIHACVCTCVSCGGSHMGLCTTYTTYFE